MLFVAWAEYNTKLNIYRGFMTKRVERFVVSKLRARIKHAIYACSNSKLKRGLAFSHREIFKPSRYIEQQIGMLLKLKRQRKF